MELEIRRFTAEQFDALDLLHENSRVLFKGPAGTGKTLLATEATKRYALQGRRTLLVCFNRLLGEWLKVETGDLETSAQHRITAGTYHQCLLQMAGCSLPQNPDRDFWAESLPNIVIDRILGGVITAPQYQALVIDEAQDLVTDRYMDVLDLLLEGGLAGGNWAMFGDFERQSIYWESTEDRCSRGSEVLRSRHVELVSFPLRINCRNTVRIAAAVEMASCLEPGYSRVLVDSPGYDVEVDFYKDPDSELVMLRKWCKLLVGRHGPGDIVILSPRQDNVSCAFRMASEKSSVRIRPLRGCVRNADEIGYASIHSFKGLEAPAVILTDIENVEAESTRALLYVGMSRARLALVVLMNEQCKDGWNDLLRRGLLVGSCGRRVARGNTAAKSL